MALDGIFLKAIKDEIKKIIINSRVNKITQPSKNEVVFTLKTNIGTKKLLININANNARINITEQNFPNPETPPMFCIILRKYLLNAIIQDITQIECDRIIMLNFKSTNNLGEKIYLKLIIEIMGKHSNIILINNQNNILDAIKKANDKINIARVIAINYPYIPISTKQKLNLFSTDVSEIIKKIKSYKDMSLSNAVMNSLQGVSPILAKEISFYVLDQPLINIDMMDKKAEPRLVFYLNYIKETVESSNCEYTILKSKDNFKDFSMVKILQYSSNTSYSTISFKSPSELLEHFFTEKDNLARILQQTKELTNLLETIKQRITKRIILQSQKLNDCLDKNKYKLRGELIISNIYSIKPESSSITVVDYYSENLDSVIIKLNPTLSPSQNAQIYFNKYKKLVNTENFAKSIIESSNQELLYIDSILDYVERATSSQDVNEIKKELYEQKYIKLYKDKIKNTKPSLPIKYISNEGFEILCGRNNKQNEYLTFKYAKNSDLWLHVKNFPGAHVIIISNGKPIPYQTIVQAANIAAINSKANISSNVPVDYTLVKYVKKQPGSRPGMVIFTNNKTIYVTPDQAKIN